MKGLELRQFLKEEGISVAFLADKLGFASEQRLYSILNANDIKSSTLEDIAKVLGKDIRWFYGLDTNNSVSSENGIAVSGDHNNIAMISERFIGLLEKKDEQIEKKDEQIDKLLELLKTK